ncbi:hypothetical protein B0T14DRAFT_567694 [Immersiella caudata]|uniref:Secreted protein n=1 Tax=Immersiella caudata TaxID=314043 RepID=A0AA39WSV6_9PEZI|nr:hypothetical protein B0T14DRAFT_567694 [Immersiella caudata]
MPSVNLPSAFPAGFVFCFLLADIALAAPVETCSRLVNIVNLFSAGQCNHVEHNWVMATQLDPQWFQTVRTSNRCQNTWGDEKSIRVSYLDKKYPFTVHNVADCDFVNRGGNMGAVNAVTLPSSACVTNPNGLWKSFAIRRCAS